MTSNQKRATNLLANSEFEGRTLHPAQARAIVHAFKDAGLLMPDLPEPELPGLWEVGELLINLVDKDGEVLIEWEADSDYIYGTQTRNLWLNRDQVLAILAAAEHMEKNQ